MSVDGDKGPSSAGALLITLYSSTALQFYRPTAAVVTVSQYKLELPAPALTVTAAAGEFVEDAPLELSTILWEDPQCWRLLTLIMMPWLTKPHIDYD